MGRAFFGIVIAVIVGAIGLSMFPTIKSILGGNSTTGFSDLLAAMYTALPYALAFFVGFAVWLAFKRRG